MDIRSYGTILPSTSKSAQPPVDTSGSSDSDSEADSECLDPKPSPPKKLCTVVKVMLPYKQTEVQQKMGRKFSLVGVQ